MSDYRPTFSEILSLRETRDRLTESNRQLREELEKVKAELKIADNWSVTQSRQRIATLTTTLAAAKEALEYAQHRARCQYALTTDELATVKTNYDNALARIAECEKE
jgi:hypothetical protein